MNFALSQKLSRARVLVALALGLLTLLTGALPASAQTETILYNFCAHTKCFDGSAPVGPLARDSKGNLYGATEQGGTSNAGVIFKLTPQGKYSVIYNFKDTTDGGQPGTGVVFDSHGNLVGFSAVAGAYGHGTVFSVDPSTGVETTLYAFGANTGDAQNPVGPPVFDSAGNMYGVSQRGGAIGNGALFKLAADGTETVLHSFGEAYGSGIDGEIPEAGLIIDKYGDLFGTTDGGGLGNDGGVVFEWNALTNIYSILYSMSLTGDGPSQPNSTLTLSANTLYGTSFTGGTATQGTVYSVEPAGGGVWSSNTLYSFSSAVGDYPQSGVLLKNGVLYGTTYRAGEGGSGSLWSLTTSGTFTTLVNFSGTTTGTYPAGNLIMDGAGNLYGVTFQGGSHSGGTIFKVTP